jgi:hypothetical protein
MAIIPIMSEIPEFLMDKMLDFGILQTRDMRAFFDY